MLSDPDLLRRFQALDLERVAISASLLPPRKESASEPSSSETPLYPVGGLWEKLTATAREAIDAATPEVVVVAAGQEVPPEYREHRHLRVLSASSLEEAIEKLYEQHGPRFAVRQKVRAASARLALLDHDPVPIDPLVSDVNPAPLYQPLPLLRAIELPLDERKDRPQRDAKVEELLLRYEEEALRSTTVRYECVRMEALLGANAPLPRGEQAPRLVVVGPPGSGKSSLLQYLAWQASCSDFLIRGRPRVPVSLSLAAWQQQKAAPDLPTYLDSMFTHCSPAPTAEQWRCWLEHGDVLLLLDGLDELDRGSVSFRNCLRQTLDRWPRCPTVLTCRTVNLADHRDLCAGLPVYQLAGLSLEGRNAFIRAYPGRFDAEALIRELDRPQLQTMRPLAHTPLLLSILCLVVDNGVPLPTTRGELYEHALRHFLSRPPRRECRYPAQPPDADGKRAILERLALRLWAGSWRQISFSASELDTALQQAVREEGYGAESRPWVNALKSDLTDDHGILRGNPKSGLYFFLHLTLAEYLTASALARLIDDSEQGWETRLRLHGRKPTVRELVGHKAWDPAWREVIALLAGRLNDLGPLLALLEDELGDDYFRHRLALAAYCLPEIEVEKRRQQQQLVARITASAFEICWDHAANWRDGVAEHLLQVLPCLEQAGAKTRQGEGAADTLCRHFQSKEPTERAAAVRLLGRVGEQAKPRHINALLPLLRDTNRIVWSSACKALGALALVARADHVDALLPLLRDTEWNVRSAACGALGALASLARADHVDALLPLLRDTGWGVSNAACDALGALALVARADHVDALLPLLRDTAWNVLNVAGDALGALASLARADHVDALLPLLRDTNWYVRSAACGALGALASLARADHVNALLPLLQDTERYVRSAACKALSALALVARADHVDALLPLLRDTEWNVRSAACGALGALASLARADHVDALLPLLRDTGWGVSNAACDALGALALVARADHVDALLPLLRDTEVNVRWEASRAIAKQTLLRRMPRNPSLRSSTDADWTWKTIDELSSLDAIRRA